MAMKLTGGLLGAALLAALVGCTSKPSQGACEKAVQNIRRLTGDTHTEAGPEQRAAIRSCQAQSSKEPAECYMSAQTREELYKCGGELADALRAAEKESAEKSGGEAAAPPPASSSSAGDGASPGTPPPPASGTSAPTGAQ
jgi:Flp pilus assembly protein TadD